jgi:hypothetical protein
VIISVCLVVLSAGIKINYKRTAVIAAAAAAFILPRTEHNGDVKESLELKVIS